MPPKIDTFPPNSEETYDVSLQTLLEIDQDSADTVLARMCRKRVEPHNYLECLCCLQPIKYRPQKGKEEIVYSKFFEKELQMIEVDGNVKEMRVIANEFSFHGVCYDAMGRPFGDSERISPTSPEEVFDALVEISLETTVQVVYKRAPLNA